MTQQILPRRGRYFSSALEFTDVARDFGHHLSVFRVMKAKVPRRHASHQYLEMGTEYSGCTHGQVSVIQDLLGSGIYGVRQRVKIPLHQPKAKFSRFWVVPQVTMLPGICLQVK